MWPGPSQPVPGSPAEALKRPLLSGAAARRLLESHLSCGRYVVEEGEEGTVLVRDRRRGLELALTWVGGTGEGLLKRVHEWRNGS